MCCRQHLEKFNIHRIAGEIVREGLVYFILRNIYSVREISRFFVVVCLLDSIVFNK